MRRFGSKGAVGGYTSKFVRRARAGGGGGGGAAAASARRAGCESRRACVRRGRRRRYTYEAFFFPPGTASERAAGLVHDFDSRDAAAAENSVVIETGFALYARARAHCLHSVAA